MARPPVIVESESRLVSGSITGGILRLAGPAMFSVLLQTLFSIADMYWVGQLGPYALAALSSATFVYWMLLSVGQMVTVGINALVARRVGARDTESARHGATQGILLALAVSALCAAGGLIAPAEFFRFMRLSETAVTEGASYLTVIFAGVSFIFLTFALEAVYRGQGDTKTPMYVLLGTLLLNIVLDPLLIHGMGPFPALGTAGAGLATIFSHAVGVVLNVSILVRRRWLARPRRVDGRVWLTLLRVGVPISIANVIFCLIYMVLARFIAPHYGDAAVAALGIGHKGESVSYLASVGFSTAAATLVGQNLGAEKVRRAEKAAWKSVGLVSLVTAAVGLVLFAFGKELAGIFTEDAGVRGAGASYLRIVALSQVFMGLEVVFEGAFGGAGHTVPPMVVVISVTLLRIPGIYVCTQLGWPIERVWWVISLTQVVRGTWITLWFRRGTWKKYRV